MSRSGYCEDCEQWSLIRWRGAVASAIRGKRGQAFLREMLDALDALPEKRLITNDLIKEGEVCALGALGQRRGLDMREVDPEDSYSVARVFSIPNALAREIEYVNDELDGLHTEDVVIDGQPRRRHCRPDTPEERFARVRQWIASQISTISSATS